MAGLLDGAGCGARAARIPGRPRPERALLRKGIATPTGHSDL